MTEPKVSIIIRCKNHWYLTKQCIDSIELNTDPELYRLIVVDDGSTDETDEGLSKYMREEHCDFVNLWHQESKGAVSATNSGLKYVLENPTPYVLILDNDTEILKNNTSWLTDMIKYFEEDESVGAVGATTDNVIGLQYVGNLTNSKEVKYLISFCLMMSLKSAKKVGMWDERFNPGNCEDLDITLRVRRAGFNLKVAKDVFIKHYCHKTFENMDLQNLIKVNEKKLLEKWGERIYYDLRG